MSTTQNNLPTVKSTSDFFTSVVTDKLTVVLDLDETLIHSILLTNNIEEELLLDQQHHCQQQDQTLLLSSTSSSFLTYPEFFDISVEGTSIRINKRPGLDQFLQWASQRFDLICFTASKSIYANAILNVLDPNGTIFQRRLFREHCIHSAQFPGVFVKDLQILNKPFERVILIDDSMTLHSCLELQRFNCSTWKNFFWIT
jgi:Dullard-like phosphatase family protein